MPYYFTLPLHSQVTKIRIKDIGKIIEARDNQLMGYGVVVGLRGTGILDCCINKQCNTKPIIKDGGFCWRN